MARIRLDKLLVKRALATDHNHALELIESGVVLVDGSVQMSPQSFIDPSSAVEFLKDKPRYVSRGGLKLEYALKTFSVDPTGKRCLDIGTSTGGFTDCLLQHGATRVVAVDVGHGQIDLSLRQDDRVELYEKTNAKNITVTSIGEMCELGVMDVSFTSVIPLIVPVVGCLNPVELVVLIKPQFECSLKDVNSRGIVTSTSAHMECIAKVRDSLRADLGMVDLDVSPISGTKGNREYLARIISAQSDIVSVTDSRINEVVNGCDS